jgi:hypothetical protein
MENTVKLTWDGILLKLKDYGVKYVWCYYSGSGDSGGIDEYSFFGEGADVDFNIDNSCFTITDQSERLSLDNESSLWNLVENKFYDTLQNVEDWYNNDGGYGEVLLSVDTGQYIIENNCYTSSSEQFMHTGKFESEI